MRSIPNIKGLDTAKRQTRLKMLESKGNHAALPSIEDGEYILDLLYEIGPVMHSGDQVVPLSFTEMASWSALTGVKLTSWETKTIRGLSVAFSREAALSLDPQREAPWQIGAIDKEAISSGIEKAFENFAKSQRKKRKKR